MKQGYHGIRQVLEDLIAKETLLPGGEFPSDVELMQRFGVSRVTIRRAVTELVDAGLVVRHRGRGSFVAPKRALPPVTSKLDQNSRQLLDITEKWDLTFLGRRPVIANPQIRNIFGLNADETVEEFQALRSLEGRNLVLLIKVLPHWVADLVPADVGDGFTETASILATHGITEHRVRQSIGAQVAESFLASRLQLRPGAPLLRINRTLWDRDRRPYSFNRAYFRADAFEYDMEFLDDMSE